MTRRVLHPVFATAPVYSPASGQSRSRRTFWHFYPAPSACPNPSP